jgi:hypothetical protein
MAGKSKLIIFDADVVLELFALGLWNQIVNAYSVILTEAVVGEAEYIEDPFTLKKTPLPLNEQIKQGSIKQVFVKVADTLAMESELMKLDAPQIHSGEKESLAYVYIQNDENLLFCSGDKAAITCARFLDKSDNLISLERTLRSAGISKSPRHHFTEVALRDTLEKANIEFIEKFRA